MKRRVAFAETDLAGVMHFSNYYRYMEEVEHAFWRSSGSCVILPDGDGELSWPRVATACEYFAPAKFEDELELQFKVKSVGERSMTYEVEFLRDSKRIALGRATAVCCATAPGKFEPVSIPANLRAILEGSKK
jgi:YbgC/YbaW family acyl-CoA thioester hydrolase